jgi:hypothetical protein
MLIRRFSSPLIEESSGTWDQPITSLRFWAAATEQACLAARTDALMANSDLDFPTLFATCQPVSRKASTAAPTAANTDQAVAA